MRAHPLVVHVASPARDQVVTAQSVQGKNGNDPVQWVELTFNDVYGKQVQAVVRAGTAVAIADALNLLVV